MDELNAELTRKIQSLKEGNVSYKQIKLAHIYTVRKNIRLQIRFPHRKEFSRYFKENEWENVDDFIKHGFEEWLNGKMIMLNQTQDKESVGVVVKTSEKVCLPTNKVIKEMSISDSRANSTIPGNIGLKKVSI